MNVRANNNKQNKKKHSPTVFRITKKRRHKYYFQTVKFCVTVVYSRASQTGGRDPARGRVTNFRGRRMYTNFTKSTA